MPVEFWESDNLFLFHLSLSLSIQVGNISAGVTFSNTCGSFMYISGIHSIRQESAIVFSG